MKPATTTSQGVKPKFTVHTRQDGPYFDKSSFENVTPCLIRELLFAPPAPTAHVTKLLEVALTYHNTGHYQQSIHTYISAQQFWMDYEFEKRRDVLAKHYHEEREQNRQYQQQLMYSQQQELNKQFDFEPSPSKDSDDEEQNDEEEGKAEQNTADEEELLSPVVESISPTDPLERQYNEEVAEMLEQSNAGEFLSLKVKLFFRLAIGSVYESAGNDDMALSEYLEAKRISDELMKNRSVSTVSDYTSSMGIRSDTPADDYSNPSQTPPLVNNPHMVDVDPMCDAALPYSCIGQIYTHVGQYAVAMRYYIKCKELRDEMLPKGHVDIALVENNIGVCHHLMTQYAEAMQYYTSSAEMLTKKLGMNHPRVMIAQRNLSLAKRKSMKEFSFDDAKPTGPIKIPVSALQLPKPKASSGKKKKKKKK